MTPLELSILLHYFACADDFRGGDFRAPAVREALQRLADRNIELLTEDLSASPASYKITERG
jgi:hypothetical protein